MISEGEGTPDSIGEKGGLVFHKARSVPHEAHGEPRG